ncbi:MAG: HAD family hydrolase [Opitutaceae bacterium]|nr:HAD family hydrolase [Opitutaceae bacterium]
MKTSLLLWDIDGTLIDSGGAGERALLSSLWNRFGVRGSLDWIAYFGRTDRWIAREILVHYGFPADEEGVTRFVDGYLAALPAEMRNPHARVLTGVEQLLKACSAAPGVLNGLLTGNMRRGASIKLGALGLEQFFDFGAFADDSEYRNELGPWALRRAGERLGSPLSPDQAVVIGDTPHDIECGRVCGARTLAVATGKYTVQELSEHKPDMLVANFEDPVPVLRWLCLAA